MLINLFEALFRNEYEGAMRWELSDAEIALNLKLGILGQNRALLLFLGHNNDKTSSL